MTRRKLLAAVLALIGLAPCLRATTQKEQKWWSFKRGFWDRQKWFVIRGPLTFTETREGNICDASFIEVNPGEMSRNEINQILSSTQLSTTERCSLETQLRLRNSGVIPEVIVPDEWKDNDDADN